jgi:pyruvate dehydrogenase E1 component beta subunit
VPVRNMIEAIRDTLGAELERDERVILLGQDIGRNGGVFRATEGLQERFGADRVVDMPLAEAVIVGSAVGLAMSGLRPVPELQFLGFGSQAFHQIEGQVARMRFRSQGATRCPWSSGRRSAGTCGPRSCTRTPTRPSTRTAPA